ncbi:MAG: glycosyltransferase family 9 protein [Bacteroidetes bacterium]|nr:glycosyltransferase family 9 protein [Bacteroidota bacterium]
MKFLIIRFSSIGDVVLTTPVIRCIKNKYPDAEIHYLTKVQFHPVLAGNPYIDKFHLMQHEVKEMLPDLKAENFDYVIDLHKNLRSVLVKRALGKPSFSFDKINFAKWIKVNLKLHLLPNKHIVNRFFDGIAKLQITNDGHGLDYFIWQNEIYDFNPPHEHGKYTALVLGAKHATKRLPFNKLEELCKNINHNIVLLGGKEEIEIGEKLNSLFPEKIINYCGKINLNQSALLVKNAGIVITHDTGLMHIASAFKKPIISIWGSTIPAFGMYPYYGEKHKDLAAQSQILEVENLSCRPCSKIGFDSCPKGHFKCMNGIDFGEIKLL